MDAFVEALNALIDAKVDAAVEPLRKRLQALENGKPPVDPEEPPVDPPEEPEPEPEPPASTGGIWASRAEIMARPTSGAAWERMLADANSSWGKANIGDNNASHDVKTLAGAFVAVRLGDNAMRVKVQAALVDAARSFREDRNRALEAGRGILSYVLAADLIGWDSDEFERELAAVIEASIQGHSGSGILGTASNSPNNWGGMCRATVAAAALKLLSGGNPVYRATGERWLALVVKAQREMVGLPVEAPQFVYQGTNWHAGTPKAGVNRPGAVINGVSVSGALPEDWRRGGEFKWLPTKSGYMHEGLQGLVNTAVILHRAGVMPFSAGDDAIVRAFNMLYGYGEATNNQPVFRYPVEGDDCWLTWVVNHYAPDASFPNQPDTTPGKGMGYGEWLFG